MKVNTRVIVSTNIDLSGRLINGQIGTVKYFAINKNEVEAIRVAFHDILAGQKKKKSMKMTLLQEKVGPNKKGKGINIPK